MAKLLFDAHPKDLIDIGFNRSSRQFFHPPSWFLHGVIASKKSNSVIISDLPSIESEVYQLLIPFFDNDSFDAKTLINKEIPRLRRFFGKPKHVSFYFNKKSNSVTLNKSEYYKQETYNTFLAENSDSNKDENIFSHEWISIPVHFRDLDILFQMHKRNMLKIAI